MSEREQLIVRRMTAAMRKADDIHRNVGGGTRHYVRDCLLPILGEYDLSVVIEDEKSSTDLTDERERFLVWWNDPDTNRYMTDFNEDQAFYMWRQIEQHHADRERDFVEALRDAQNALVSVLGEISHDLAKLDPENNDGDV